MLFYYSLQYSYVFNQLYINFTQNIMQQYKIILQLLTEVFDNDTAEVDEAICQYNYMMRVSQPDVPCPDSLTILTLLEYHDYLMSIPNDEICSEMSYPTDMNTTMVRVIEQCF